MKILPRYKHCFVCGKENPIGVNLHFETDGEYVYAKTSLNKNYIGYENRVHGGIIAGLIDEAMGWACTVKEKKLYYTIELDVKYKKPVHPNEMVFIKAQMNDIKHNVAMASGILKDEAGTILVSAKGKYMPINKNEEDAVLAMLHHDPEDNKVVTREDL